MKKNKWIVLAIVAVIIVYGLGIFAVSRLFILYDDSTQLEKTPKNNIKSDNNETKKYGEEEQEKTTKDNTESSQKEVLQGLDFVDGNEFVEEQKLLKKFGFYENIGCGANVYSKTYSKEYKTIMALTKVEKDKIKVVSCNQIFNDSNYDSQMNAYKGESGVCFKDKSTDVISYEDANALYKELYGVDLPKESVSSTKQFGMFYHFYDYVSAMDSFVKMSCSGCGGSCGIHYTINKIKSSNEKDGILRIEVYYFHASLNDNKTGDYKLNTDNGEKHFNVSSENELINELKTHYKDYSDIYEVSFKKNGNAYNFIELNKK